MPEKIWHNPDVGFLDESVAGGVPEHGRMDVPQLGSRFINFIAFAPTPQLLVGPQPMQLG
jgi:hypothetical protein